ncbi:helix-turn-helix transcriptional regulator [Paenibacillus apiarius]|uniref:WYL domain-containing protein n=1 Tax=Paenibacillus apiarius TaxID=46240 RepID=A0ABT4DYV1_9BACL|nr:WYL domain-containing protein [Paenibacillus apiarius]MCY9514857.1 WYL domain-containing protein [Paenibacillus apiarius]MCY9521263.1 WYL domain-containing protein [Paenibacillus apiarius]MCY9553979.1 WYL domain-containing protein [Paenibacillus apiarius]MCY9560353.1 WYL domain-containing protein [Paenibacillus apiarius]MCY9682309.1 WYL domain-containing protein [Paenibacillus apiarius]
MPKIDNVLAILWMLSSDEKITAKQISEKLEMNIRTVYRYIDTLSTSGVPIISDTGHNGGYTLLNNFIEAPLFFDFEEQTSLFHAAVFAEEAGYYGGEALNRAISKLSKYSNQEQETKINQHLTSLEVISRISSLSMEPFLKELEQAVADGYSVKIRYHKSGKEQSKYRLVDPYRIIYWNNKWYVIGFCHLRNDIRSFRVERIESLMLTGNKFNRPENFSARDFFLKNLLPTIEDKEGIISLVINGNKSTLNDVCQHWFLGNYLQERTANQAVFLLEKDIIHTYVPYLLLPYGKSIQVIEPKSLKKRLIEVLSELIQFHQV